MKGSKQLIHSVFLLSGLLAEAQITSQMIADGQAARQGAVTANKQTYIRSEADHIACLNEFSTDAAARTQAEIAEIEVLRQEPGLAVLFNDPALVPVRVEAGNLVFITNDNLVAADTIHTDSLWPGGSSPLPDLTGAGRRVGIWESGGEVYTSHVELAGRVVQADASPTTNPGAHATQVAGTIAASGLKSTARGAAYEANLTAYEAENDKSEMAAEAAKGLTLSNHSYGLVAGWRFLGGLGWTWFGEATAGEDPRFGFYEAESREFDLILFEAKYYLSVHASGNEASDFGPVQSTDGIIAPGTLYYRIADTNNDGNVDSFIVDITPHPSDGGAPTAGATILIRRILVSPN